MVGAFGNSLVEEGKAQAAGIPAAATERLAALGVAINYHAYGDTIDDLHVPPAELAAEMLKYAGALELAQKSKTYRALAEGYRDDLGRGRSIRSGKPRAPSSSCCPTRPGPAG